MPPVYIQGAEKGDKMAAITSTVQSKAKDGTSDRAGLCKLGAVVALLIISTAVLEIVTTFLPGGYASAETLVEWFNLLHNNWFLGLRNLGLLNIVMTALGIPMFFVLFSIHRQGNPVHSTLALIISLVGVAVFYATNRAFPMLDLSIQYAAATTDVQRMIIEAAGQAMLAVGQSHTPGTFLGFFFSEIAGIMISLVMLRGGIFSKGNAYAGILGFGMLLVYEICQSFVPALLGVVLIFAMIGGILNLVWYGLIARRLLQLA
jgi:hypothetical protein